MPGTKSGRQKPLDNLCYDDDVIYPDISLLSHSSSTSSLPIRPGQTGLECEADQLIASLTGLGFDSAYGFVRRYGAQRIHAALRRALSQPRGTIRNLPGYIRYLVATPGPIPKPKRDSQPNDKYTSGKYGHIVQR
ncbi:hypothetical protein ACFLXA_05620 [Chloroflexota bacterium]